MERSYFKKLDGNGIAWVQECLEGGSTLSKDLLKVGKIDKGNVIIAISTPEHDAAAQNNQPLRYGPQKIGQWFHTDPHSLFHPSP